MEGKLKVCAIKDMFTIWTVENSTDLRMNSRSAVNALDKTIGHCGHLAGYLLHTDKGSRGGFKRSSRDPRFWRCVMVSRQQAADRAVRPKLRSPGSSRFRRPVVAAFWEQIAKGPLAEEVTGVFDMAQSVGAR